jgi:hypothetical protein
VSSAERDKLSLEIDTLDIDQLKSAVWFMLGSVGAKEVGAAVWHVTRAPKSLLQPKPETDNVVSVVEGQQD